MGVTTWVLYDLTSPLAAGCWKLWHRNWGKQVWMLEVFLLEV